MKLRLKKTWVLIRLSYRFSQLKKTWVLIRLSYRFSQLKKTWVLIRFGQTRERVGSDVLYKLISRLNSRCTKLNSRCTKLNSRLNSRKVWRLCAVQRNETDGCHQRCASLPLNQTKQ